jgi:hypothetical protein
MFSQKNNLDSIINGELFKIKEYSVTYFIKDRLDFNSDIYNIKTKNNYFKYSNSDTLYLNYLNTFQNFKLYHITSKKLFHEYNFKYEDEQINGDYSTHIGNVGNKLLLVDCKFKKQILLNFNEYFYYDINKNGNILTINKSLSKIVTVLDDNLRAIEVIKSDNSNNQLYLFKLKYFSKSIICMKYLLDDKFELEFMQIPINDFYKISKRNKKLLKSDVLKKDYKLINIFYYIFNNNDRAEMLSVPTM